MKERLINILGTLIFVVFLGLCVYALAGCAPDAPANQHAAQVGESIEGARQAINSADSATTQIEPHTDATGKVLAKTIHDGHHQAIVKLSDADIALAQAKADAAKAETENIQLKAQVDGYKNAWFGGKFWRLVGWLTAGATIITLVIVGLRIFQLVSTGGVGGVGIGVLGTIGKLLGGVVPVIGAGVNTLFDHIIHRKIVTAVAANPAVVEQTSAVKIV